MVKAVHSFSQYPRRERNKLQRELNVSLDSKTKQKNTESVIRESEKRFRELSELLPEVVFETDIKGVITYVNRSAFELFDFSEQDIENGLNFIGLLTPDSQKKARKNLERILSGERLNKSEYVGVRKDGGTFQCLGHCAVIIKENKPVGIRGILVDITEQKKAENEIQGLAKFPSENPAPVLRIAEDGSILYANKATKTLEEKMKQNKEQIISDKMKEAIFSSFKSGLTETVEVNYGNRIFSFVIAPIPEEKYLNIYGRDITEQKKIENELKQSEQRFRAIFEGATDGIVAINPKTYEIVFSNPQMSEITGYPSDELRKLSVLDLIQKESLQFFVSQFQKHFEKKLTITQGIPVLRKDGQIVYCDGKSKIMKIGDENYLIGFVRDVTEQKKVEKALRESEENYRSIINAMDDTVWVIDFSGKFVDVNDSAVKALGYSREELLSMGPPDIDNKLSLKQIEKIIDEMKNGKSQVFETEHKTKDAKILPVEIGVTQVTYYGKPAILSIARDITERKKAQEAVKEANVLLKESNKELESYTYVVSHDLKAPLRTIRSFASFILEDYADKLDETGKDYLNRMINASSHLDVMIEDLLVLSRVGRKFTEREKVDLNKLVNEIVTDLEATIKERNAQVIVDKLPTLYVHRVWKKQLFMNLISNALKFNESKTPKIEVLYAETENDHLFKIRDNGIGIQEKYLSTIFNLFERAPTDKKYDGTGAGLAICKKIVEHLGGKIWVESTLGKGSSFFFTIPKNVKQEKEE
ncbi:MAG: PAS domain S-box protein [archaeon]